MKNLISSIVVPKIYEHSGSSLQRYHAKTANSMALALILVVLLGMLSNFFRNDPERVFSYFLIGICFPLAIFLSHKGHENFSRICMAFYPGAALFILPLIHGGIVSGSREGYFFALLIVSFIPLLLFSDTKENALFFLGFAYYFCLFLCLDLFLSFKGEHLPPSHRMVSAIFREMLFYWAIAGCFLIKLSIKTQIAKELAEKNKEITKQNIEIERLLEEVRAQNAEVLFQQEMLSVQNARLLKQQEEMQAINERLEKHNDALMQLASDGKLTSGDYEEALKILTAKAVKTLDVSRASIWELDEGKETIRCMDLYMDNAKDHACGMELNAKDCPVYFSAIRANKTIVAEDASVNHFTAEFSDTYLAPLQIRSMLDSPIYINGELSGIVCFEHQHEIRKWSAEDIVFSRAIADMVPLAYESMLRRKAQDVVTIQNELLRSKQEEILQINNVLEEKVVQRTDELQKKNKVLQDYAFFNAHVLRAPVCSLVGLFELEASDHAYFTDVEFSANFRRTLRELEGVTKEISARIKSYDEIDNK